ncbi:hypothetical protein BZG36_05499, partial [Bifiguratus adelaidae]
MSEHPATLPNLGADDNLPEPDPIDVTEREAEPLPATHNVQQRHQPIPNVGGQDVVGQRYHHTGEWRYRSNDSDYFERHPNEALPQHDPFRKSSQPDSANGIQEEDEPLYIPPESNSEQQDRFGGMSDGAEALATKALMHLYDKVKAQRSTGNLSPSRPNEEDPEENPEKVNSHEKFSQEERPPAIAVKAAVLNRRTTANGQDRSRPDTLQVSHLHQTWHEETKNEKSPTSGLGLDFIKRRPFARVDTTKGKIKASDERNQFHEDFTFNDAVNAIHKLNQNEPAAKAKRMRPARIATTDSKMSFLKSIHQTIADVHKSVADVREQVDQNHETNTNAPARINGWQRFRKKYREMIAETLGVTIMTVLG